MKPTRLSTFIVFLLPARIATSSAYLSWSAFDLLPRPTGANQITLGDPECLFAPCIYSIGNDSSISVYTDSWGIQRCISWHWSCPHNLGDDSLFFGIQVPGRISCAHPSLVVNSTSITDVDIDNATSRPNVLITPTGM
jgi:hypothetical protein